LTIAILKSWKKCISSSQFYPIDCLQYRLIMFFFST